MTSISKSHGYTLIELLVAIVILSLLCVILASMTQMIAKTWTSTTAKIEQFNNAREGFESMTRRLSQAVLNTYWDYDRDANGNPIRYIRESELRFVSGPGLAGSAATTPPRPTHSVFFQAPLGYSEVASYGNLGNLLNTWGYYIEYSDDSQTRPSFTTQPVRTRFRLIEMTEPTENLTLYQYTSGTNSSGNPKNPSYQGSEWYTHPLSASPKRVMAENIIALVILPRFAAYEKNSSAVPFSADALAPAYSYDTTVANADPETNSKNQLPPVLQVAMVAIDEASAERMSAQANQLLLQKIGSLFTNASAFTSDLYLNPQTDVSQDPSLEAYLIRNKINYRILTTNISLKSAKWSTEQAD